MSRTPILGITTYAPSESQPRYTLPPEYVAAVRRAGGLPWLLPPGEPRWSEFLDGIDALILPGGGDIDPALYGGVEHAAIYGRNRARDESEIALVRAAIERGKPTLCICRGCQVLNVALGGTLVEHLPDLVGTRVPHRGSAPGEAVPHEVDIVAGSRLATILGTVRAETSSSHHQAIRSVGAGLEVVARAPDGTVEAVEMRAHPFLVAVQWHPEHTAGEDPVQQRLFDALVRAVR